MTANDHQPYRGGTAQADPPSGAPVSPPVRPVKRTWWVLPFTGGALAVIVAAAAVTAVLHTPQLSQQATAASSTGSSSGAAKGPRCRRRCSPTPCSAS